MVLGAMMEDRIMGASTEPTALLRRGDYPIHPAANLSDPERQLLGRYGYWLEALSCGDVAPETADQTRFVQVARGAVEPKSAFELAWVKLQMTVCVLPHQVRSTDLAERVERLQLAREEAKVIDIEYNKRRDAILASVQPLLDAVECEFKDRLRASAEEMSQSEADVREAAVAFGSNFQHAGLKITYSKARVTWDQARISKYMETHPEIAEFRKVGKPWVSLRYEGAKGQE